MENDIVYMRTANELYNKITELMEKFKNTEDSVEKISLVSKMEALLWVLKSPETKM